MCRHLRFPCPPRLRSAQLRPSVVYPLVSCPSRPSSPPSCLTRTCSSTSSLGTQVSSPAPARQRYPPSFARARTVIANWHMLQVWASRVSCCSSRTRGSSPFTTSPSVVMLHYFSFLTFFALNLVPQHLLSVALDFIISFSSFFRSRIRCAPGVYWDQTHQAADMGHCWSRSFPIHHTVLLSWCSWCLIGVRHYSSRYIQPFDDMVRRCTTTFQFQHGHHAHRQQKVIPFTIWIVDISLSSYRFD